jgi:hypothetical protein
MERLEFTDGDRTFTCRAEASTATPDTLWWWLSVGGESSRYAAFRAEKRDTEKTLRPRIVAYYEELLAVRARPAETRFHWSQRRRAELAANGTGEAAVDPAAATQA